MTPNSKNRKTTLIKENPKEQTSPSKTGFWANLPPLRSTLLCLFIDSATIITLVTYYQILTPWWTGAFPGWQRVAAASSLNLPGILLFLILGFWIIPTFIYTIFKAIKIPILATGSVSGMPTVGKLFLVNLAITLLSFIHYAVFELLGLALLPPLVPIVAGTYLLIGFAFLGIATCTIHHRVWIGEHHPFSGALSTFSFKRSFPYLFYGSLGLAGLNVIAYLTFSFGLPPWIGTGFHFGSILCLFFFLNAYQWSVYHEESETR